jgi:hypothetical protein
VTLLDVADQKRLSFLVMQDVLGKVAVRGIGEHKALLGEEENSSSIWSAADSFRQEGWGRATCLQLVGHLPEREREY